MTSSDSPEPETPHNAPGEEAQRAADGLKEQIAAVRDRVREARDALTEQARRSNETRTFKR
jgi:hypothetical protein